MSSIFIDSDTNIENITCQGCKDNIFNQLGHMEIGGCLYESSESSESSESPKNPKNPKKLKK